LGEGINDKVCKLRTPQDVQSIIETSWKDKMLALISLTTRTLWNYVRSYIWAEKDTAIKSPNGKAIKIEYVYLGEKYSLWVPFSRQRQFEMYEETLIAETSTGSTFQIKQQPGINYLVSADDLGVKSLILATEDAQRKFEKLSTWG